MKRYVLILFGVGLMGTSNLSFAKAPIIHHKKHDNKTAVTAPQNQSTDRVPTTESPKK